MMKNRVTPAILAVLVTLAVWTLRVPPAAAADAFSALIADLGSNDRGRSQHAKEELLAQGKKAVPQLIAALDDPDENKKAAVVIILGQLKAAEAVPRLIEELKSENVPVRLMSAFALGMSGDSRALPHLVAMLGPGNDRDARGAALVALGYLKNKDAIPQVKAALADPEQYTRILAATALGALENHDGLDEALNGTRSDNQTLVYISIQALGMIGDPKALPRLEELIRGSASWNSEIELTKKQIAYANVAPEKRIDVLRGHLEDPYRNVAEWAVTTLADLGTPESISLLEEKARAGKSRTGELAQRKLKMLGK